MDKWIAYSIACGLSFFGFGAGVFVAAAPYGDVLAGVMLAFLGLSVFCLSIVCALRETGPPVEYSALGHLYEGQTTIVQSPRTRSGEALLQWAA